MRRKYQLFSHHVDFDQVKHSSHFLGSFLVARHLVFQALFPAFGASSMTLYLQKVPDEQYCRSICRNRGLGLGLHDLQVVAVARGRDCFPPS